MPPHSRECARAHTRTHTTHIDIAGHAPAVPPQCVAAEAAAGLAKVGPAKGLRSIPGSFGRVSLPHYSLSCGALLLCRGGRPRDRPLCNCGCGCPSGGDSLGTRNGCRRGNCRGGAGSCSHRRGHYKRPSWPTEGRCRGRERRLLRPGLLLLRPKSRPARLSGPQRRTQRQPDWRTLPGERLKRGGVGVHAKCG